MGEQINVLTDISGTAFSLLNNATLADETAHKSAFTPTDVFLSVGYL
jgi:hypothetical protein